MLFVNEDSEKLQGFIFKFNINSKVIFAYQQAYAGSRIQNKNVLNIIKKGVNKYDLFEDKLLRIDRRAEILIVDNELYIKNVNILQDKFGFQKYVRAEDKNIINKLDELDLVSDVAKIRVCESKGKLTYAKNNENKKFSCLEF